MIAEALFKQLFITKYTPIVRRPKSTGVVDNIKTIKIVVSLLCISFLVWYACTVGIQQF